MTSLLTPAELVTTTGKQQHCAQARVLTGWGVPFKRRPDGSLVVSRTVLEAALAGTGPQGVASTSTTSANGLNWTRQA